MSKIDYSKLRSLTAKEIINALIKDGFFLDRQSGSHQQYRHQDGRVVTVSFHHSSDTFHPKILKSMIEKQAKWNEDDLKKVKSHIIPMPNPTLLTPPIHRLPPQGFAHGEGKKSLTFALPGGNLPPGWIAVISLFSFELLLQRKVRRLSPISSGQTSAR